MLAQIGPAVNSNKSFLIYGQPGNGKTALAEALFRVDTEADLLAVRDQRMPGQHHSTGGRSDLSPENRRPGNAVLRGDLDGTAVRRGRFRFKCRRPCIITGGELGLDMLDLSYNRVSKVYDAPFQLKANNGIYLIPERLSTGKKASPAEILNRWIVPMERNTDYLSFQAGGKMTVPFEAFLIFSTNLRLKTIWAMRRSCAAFSTRMFLRTSALAGIHPDLRALRRGEAAPVSGWPGPEVCGEALRGRRQARCGAFAILAT